MNPMFGENNLSELTELKTAMRNLFAGAGEVGAVAIRLPNDRITGEVVWGFVQPDPTLGKGKYVIVMSIDNAGVKTFAWEPK